MSFVPIYFNFFVGGIGLATGLTRGAPPHDKHGVNVYRGANLNPLQLILLDLPVGISGLEPQHQIPQVSLLYN